VSHFGNLNRGQADERSTDGLIACLGVLSPILDATYLRGSRVTK